MDASRPSEGANASGSRDQVEEAWEVPEVQEVPVTEEVMQTEDAEACAYYEMVLDLSDHEEREDGEIADEEHRVSEAISLDELQSSI